MIKVTATDTITTMIKVTATDIPMNMITMRIRLNSGW
jgi:hypothetical protein